MRKAPALTARVSTRPSFEVHTNPITLYVTDRTGAITPEHCTVKFYKFKTHKNSLVAHHTRLETHFKEAIMIINSP